jgi:hypothetical protein
MPFKKLTRLTPSLVMESSRNALERLFPKIAEMLVSGTGVGDTAVGGASEAKP